MRTNHLFLLGAIVLTIFVYSCGPSASEKRLNQIQDSLLTADSIAKAEAEAAALAEQARLDSIRQDSIVKAEKIIAAMPTFKEIEDNRGSLEGMFKRKGFIISYAKGEAWNPETTYFEYTPRIVAKLNSGGTPSFSYVENDNGYKVTITGAPEKLERFGKDAKAWLKKWKAQAPDDWYYQEFKVTVSGNTVIVYWPTGD